MVFGHERIAAGKNNFIKLRIGGYVLERRLPVAFIALVLGIREVAAEAVAAVDRTTAFHQQ